MKTTFTILLIFTLFGCSRHKSNCSTPDYVYKNGEKATLKQTQEEVRILRNFSHFVTSCPEGKSGRYKIRFNDGSEISVDWDELKPIKAT